MNPSTPLAKPDAKRSADAPTSTPRYEPPRILAKRSIEHVTLVSTPSGPIGPGSPIGGE